MARPPDAVGESLEAGSLYRLVPNWSTHWDYERNLPEPRAFRKDGDIGVSMVIKERMPLPDIFKRKPQLSAFAVCELSVEELLAEEGVWVMLDHDDEGFGDAHVLVIGITKRRVDWLRALAIKRIVKFPAAATPDERP